MGTYTVKYISLNTHLGANFCSKRNLPLMLCVRRGTTDIKIHCECVNLKIQTGGIFLFYYLLQSQMTSALV